MASPTTFRIADYLPMRARRAAAARTYGKNHRCADGMCPLAVALHALELDGPKVPNAVEVARRLAPVAHETRSLLESAAIAFISAWDAGRVADLAAAWDVLPEEE